MDRWLKEMKNEKTLVQKGLPGSLDAQTSALKDSLVWVYIQHSPSEVQGAIDESLWGLHGQSTLHPHQGQKGQEMNPFKTWIK